MFRFRGLGFIEMTVGVFGRGLRDWDLNASEL